MYPAPMRKQVLRQSSKIRTATFHPLLGGTPPHRGAQSWSPGPTPRAVSVLRGEPTQCGLAQDTQTPAACLQAAVPHRASQRRGVGSLQVLPPACWLTCRISLNPASLGILIHRLGAVTPRGLSSTMLTERLHGAWHLLGVHACQLQSLLTAPAPQLASTRLQAQMWAWAPSKTQHARSLPWCAHSTVSKHHRPTGPFSLQPALLSPQVRGLGGPGPRHRQVQWQVSALWAVSPQGARSKASLVCLSKDAEPVPKTFVTCYEPPHPTPQLP